MASAPGPFTPHQDPRRMTVSCLSLYLETPERYSAPGAKRQLLKTVKNNQGEAHPVYAVGNREKEPGLWAEALQLGVKSYHLYDVVANSVPHEVSHRVKVELAHQVRAMSFRRLHTQVKSDGDFLTGLAFGN